MTGAQRYTPLLVLLAATIASAALPPEHYQAAREQAPYHLQVRMDKVTLIQNRTRGGCEVEATVLRDFRGALQEGSRLRFLLNCAVPGRSPVPGPNTWHDYQLLKSARLAEGFFQDRHGVVVPTHGQLNIIASEREWPWCEPRNGHCNLPPLEPLQILECSTPGQGGTGRQVRGGWVIRIADHHLWYWSDVSRMYFGDGRHWQAHQWEPQRMPPPLQLSGDRYTQVAHRYTQGGEVLLMTRHFSYERSTGRFQERNRLPEGAEEVVDGVCRPIADPETLLPAG